MSDPHLPSRPGWHCRGCGSDWPCAPAQAELIVSYADAPVSLSLFLAGQFTLALEDLSKLHASCPPTPEQVFHRVLGWARDSRRDTT